MPLASRHTHTRACYPLRNHQSASTKPGGLVTATRRAVRGRLTLPPAPRMTAYSSASLVTHFAPRLFNSTVLASKLRVCVHVSPQVHASRSVTQCCAAPPLRQSRVAAFAGAAAIGRLRRGQRHGQPAGRGAARRFLCSASSGAEVPRDPQQPRPAAMTATEGAQAAAAAASTGTCMHAPRTQAWCSCASCPPPRSLRVPAVASWCAGSHV